MDIVKLIGADVLPDDQKLIIDIARVIRVGFLQQHAFHPVDTYCPLDKQFRMMKIMLHLYHRTKAMLSEGVPLDSIRESGVFEMLLKIKYDIPNQELEQFDQLTRNLDHTLDGLSVYKKEGIV